MKLQSRFMTYSHTFLRYWWKRELKTGWIYQLSSMKCWKQYSIWFLTHICELCNKKYVQSLHITKCNVLPIHVNELLSKCWHWNSYANSISFRLQHNIAPPLIRYFHRRNISIFKENIKVPILYNQLLSFRFVDSLNTKHERFRKVDVHAALWVHPNR